MCPISVSLPRRDANMLQQLGEALPQLGEALLQPYQLQWDGVVVTLSLDDLRAGGRGLRRSYYWP